MATLAFTDAVVEIGGNDVSQWVTQVEFSIEIEELEDTTMGSSGRSRIPGLQDSSISITFTQDYEPGKLDEIMSGLLGTVATISVRPTSAAVSTDNPMYVGDYLISQWNPFGNSVGEVATVEVEWPLSSRTGISRVTSP